MFLLSEDQAGRIESIISGVGNDVIGPAFRNLSDTDIAYKGSAEDPVTRIDQEAEKCLRERLPCIVPGSVFVGEETCARDKENLNLLAQNRCPVWVVDPIDGTDRFIEGKDGFGIMACLIVQGAIIASWLYEVPHKRMTAFYAPAKLIENGRSLVPQGFNDDGAAADVAPVPCAGLVGKKLSKFKAVRDLKATSKALSFDVSQTPSILAYRDLLHGRHDFLVYKRTMPWDHLPGLAMVTAAGGIACQWSGAPVTLTDTREGLVVARNRAVRDLVLDAIIGPLLKCEEVMRM